MDLSHNKRTRQLRGEGTLLFLFKYHQVSRKFTAKEEKKKKKKDSQTVGYWCVVFTSIRRSERTFLGTTVIFLKKLQMCLQMKNTLFHSSSPKEVALTLLAHKWKGPTRSSVADESILTNRQNSSHLFLQKSLSFIFTLSTVIS